MKRLPLFIIPLLIATYAQAQKPADQILGQWYSEDNVSKINVVKKDGKYFGSIIWLDEPNYPDDDKQAGKPKRDRENRDKKLRKRPIIGLEMLKNFTYNASDKEWEDGTIYDPDVGKLYKCVIKFKEGSKDGKNLDVRGYIGIPALGRTTAWNKVPEEELEKIE